MSLIQRLSPITTRLAHILAAKKATRVLSARWTIDKPVLAIFFGGPSRDLYQIRQWMPVFEELQDELRTVVLMKDAVAALELAKTSLLPVRLAGSADDVEPMATEWGLKAMFYVNNNLANFSVLRLPDIRHIHLSHGESEKVSMTSNQLKAYDYCFVAGQASADRIMASLSLFDKSHLKLVGRPQLDQLLNAKTLPAIAGRKTVLYAPTWEGDRPAMAYSSVAVAGEAWIKELLANHSLRVIYRPHPKTGTLSAATRLADQRIRDSIEAATKAEPDVGHMVDTSNDCSPAMISAHVAIFDVSAMAMDFSVLNRPYFVSVPTQLEDTVSGLAMWAAARPLQVTGHSVIGPAVTDALVAGPLDGAAEFALRHFGDLREGTGFRQFRLAIHDAL